MGTNPFFKFLFPFLKTAAILLVSLFFTERMRRPRYKLPSYCLLSVTDSSVELLYRLQFTT